VSRILEFARSHQLLPEAHLYGFALVLENTANGQEAYALGMHSTTGWWWYFPFALLVKTPTGTLLCGAVALGLALRRRQPGSSSGVLLCLPPLLFLLFSMSRNMNIGVRHIMPVLPFLWLGAGAAFPASSTPGQERLKAVVLALAFSGILETALALPGFIGFFNLPAVLVAKPHALLVDSNLDWGQDLGRLKRYMDKAGIAEIKLAYFGSASPRHLGLAHEWLPSFNVYRAMELEWPRAIVRPGDLIAISATTLAGDYVAIPNLREYLKDRLEPVGKVGCSIHLFRVRSQ
jgi:hypothetical protein